MPLDTTRVINASKVSEVIRSRGVGQLFKYDCPTQNLEMPAILDIESTCNCGNHTHPGYSRPQVKLCHVRFARHCMLRDAFSGVHMHAQTPPKSRGQAWRLCLEQLDVCQAYQAPYHIDACILTYSPRTYNNSHTYSHTCNSEMTARASLAGCR